MNIPRAPAIFGVADGMTCAMGIVIGLVLIHAPAASIFAAGFSAGLAEFPGMASGQYQSAPRDGWAAAIVCGLASTVGALLPVTPWLFFTGTLALITSLAIAAVMCFLIAVFQTERTWRTYAISFGVTAIAIGLCIAGSFVPH